MAEREGLKTCRIFKFAWSQLRTGDFYLGRRWLSSAQLSIVMKWMKNVLMRAHLKDASRTLKGSSPFSLLSKASWRYLFYPYMPTVLHTGYLCCYCYTFLCISLLFPPRLWIPHWQDSSFSSLYHYNIAGHVHSAQWCWMNKLCLWGSDKPGTLAPKSYRRTSCVASVLCVTEAVCKWSYNFLQIPIKYTFDEFLAFCDQMSWL